jgi:hypothetical protein
MSAGAALRLAVGGGVGACRGRRRGCHRRHQRRRGRPGVGLVAFHGPRHVEEEGQRKRERERSETCR